MITGGLRFDCFLLTIDQIILSKLSNTIDLADKANYNKSTDIKDVSGVDDSSIGIVAIDKANISKTAYIANVDKVE